MKKPPGGAGGLWRWAGTRVRRVAPAGVGTGRGAPVRNLGTRQAARGSRRGNPATFTLRVACYAFVTDQAPTIPAIS